MNDRVHLPDVGQELVAQPLAFAGALHQSGDVDELDCGRHGPLRVHDLGQRIQPGIGDLDDAGVRLDGGKRIVRHQRLGGREGVEERGLADVGQSDNSESKHDPATVTTKAQEGHEGLTCSIFVEDYSPSLRASLVDRSLTD